MSEQVTILNCRLDNLYKEDLLEKFNEGVLLPTNVDMIVKMQKDREFYRCFCQAEFKVNDSYFLKLASGLLGLPLKDIVSGSDFFPCFYRYHKDNKDVRVFLLGAEEGIGRQAMDKINANVNRQIVIGCYSPPLGFEKDEATCMKIVDMINKSNATVLAVGLGAPKQEKWVYKYKDHFTAIKRILCIGATIDFEAGYIKRAPPIIRKYGLEWLFRLLKEPKRLWKRYLIEDTPFFWLFVKQLLGIYKNPFEDS
ncbi:MAG: WecB/TagA/CpsF family glycosyltransferase [Chitinispirillaceae bacterium]|jgi:exopolysaccharide biosynthesis WecB/TagA/CpsF family protein